MALLGRIDPQPPKGIKYMLGDETWMPINGRSPLRLLCEGWGNLGPLELDRDIQNNSAGLRVRHTEIPAPDGAFGFAQVDGVYYWTDTDMYGRTPQLRDEQSSHRRMTGRGGG